MSADGGPEWYTESYRVDLSISTLRTLEDCLSARMATLPTDSPAHAMRGLLHDRIADLMAGGLDEGDRPSLTVSGREYSCLYGVLVTIQYGSPPAAFETSPERVDAAQTEMRDQAPDDRIVTHIDLVERGMESMFGDRDTADAFFTDMVADDE